MTSLLGVENRKSDGLPARSLPKLPANAGFWFRQEKEETLEMKVLVPIDGSSCCINTLDWIADNLDKSRNQYTLLFVIPKSFSELEDEETDQIDETVRLLKEGRWYLERKGCLVERAEYVLGDPVEAICRYAEEMRVDEIVIGSHGGSGSRHSLLGSVSSGVFELCDKPVFVYRNRNRVRVMYPPQ